MQPYQYIVQPTPNGNAFMPRADYRGTKTKAELLAEVATRTGANPSPELVIHTYFEVVIDFCKQGWKCEPFDELIGFRFTCGGSHPTNNFQGSFESLDISPSCNLGEAGVLRASDDFTSEKTAEQARVGLVFTLVKDTFTGGQDHYTADKTLQVDVANKKIAFDRNQSSNIVRFRKTDGTFVNSPEVILKGRTFSIRVPTPLTGSVELHISCEINGSLRTSIYSNALLP